MDGLGEAQQADGEPVHLETRSRGDDNAVLLERCVAGDARAWEDLVGRYERLVYAVPRREGLSLEESADVTQTTFATLLESASSIREPDKLGSWLMTVARRHVWRIRKRRVDYPHPPQSLALRAEPVTPDEDLYVRAAAVHEAIQQLHEPCRSLILGLFFDPTEPSYAELAIGLGRPLGSIGPLRARCLDHLRTMLDDSAGTA